MYLTRLANRVLKPFGNKALEQLVLLGAVNFYDYVFSLEKLAWIRVCDIAEVDKLKLQESIDYSEVSFEVPKFTPPTSMYVEKVLTLEEKYHNLEEALIEKEGLVEGLNQQLNALNQSLEQTLEKDQASESIINELQLKIENLHEEMGQRAGELSPEEMQASIEGFKKEEELKQKKIEGLDEEIETLVQEMTQVLDENKYLKKKVAKYRVGFENEREMGKALKSNVKKLNQGMIKLQTVSKNSKILIQDLEKYKAAQEHKEKEELQILIGDSFEIDNSALWMIQLDGEEKGPFAFSDVLGFMNYKKITKETPLKRKGETYWQTATKYQEFTSKIFTAEESVDGEDQTHYYMKRGEFRAPFYETAIIELEGKEFRGYCTSLSAGGCFFETPRVSNRHYGKGVQVKIRIIEGTLSKEISAMAEICSISKEKPKGLGLQFVLIGDEEKEIIGQYVETYIANSTKAS